MRTADCGLTCLPAGVLPVSTRTYLDSIIKYSIVRVSVRFGSGLGFGLGLGLLRSVGCFGCFGWFAAAYPLFLVF